MPFLLFVSSAELHISCCNYCMWSIGFGLGLGLHFWEQFLCIPVVLFVGSLLVSTSSFFAWKTRLQRDFNLCLITHSLTLCDKDYTASVFD